MDEKVLYLSKGSAEEINAKRIDAEIIEIEVFKKRRWIYAGVIPQLVTRPRSGIIGWIRDHVISNNPQRVRLHIVRDIEPYCRDFYTGEMVTSEKMYRVLLERGVIDQYGNILDKLGAKRKPLKKDKKPLTDVEFLAYEANYEDWLKENPKTLITFEDVSPTEYILEDTLLLHKHKSDQNMIIAAKKSFVSMRDVTLLVAIIGGFLTPLIFVWIVVDGDIFKYFGNPVPYIWQGVNKLWTGLQALKSFNGV